MNARTRLRTILVAAMVSAPVFGALAQEEPVESLDLTKENVAPTNCRPVFPEAAVRSRAHGVTSLAFHVDAAGKVTQVDILKRSGPTREHRLLDEAAAYGLAGCSFTPDKDADGKPIATVRKTTYAWRIE